MGLMLRHGSGGRQKLQPASGQTERWVASFCRFRSNRKTIERIFHDQECRVSQRRGPGLNVEVDETWALRVVRRRLEPSVVLMVVGIVVMSGLDAIFTLTLMGTGQVHEWNPVMAMLIERDVQLFAALKTLVTTGGVVALAMFVDHSVFQAFRVRRVLEFFFVAYSILMVYHLSLMARVFLQ